MTDLALCLLTITVSLVAFADSSVTQSMWHLQQQPCRWPRTKHL